MGQDEEDFHRAAGRLWRNYPTHPCTFAGCARGCKGAMARGGGLCADCSESELAKVVGGKNAARYHSLVREIRRLETDMLSEL